MSHFGRITFGVLGSLEAQAGDRGLDLGPLKQRVLLAMLLCRANSVVSMQELLDALWPDSPPRTAMKNLQVYVSQLRKILSTGPHGSLIAFRSPGYRITLEPAQLDALRFEDLTRSGRLSLRSGDSVRASALLREALDLWRGPALSDLCAGPRLQAELGRLEGRRLATYEDWFDAEFALGHETDVLDELDELGRVHPLRERLRSQQMIALYRCGRQAEALAVFDEIRQTLARELGLAPSPALRRLYQSILADDPSLGATPPAEPAAAHLAMAPVTAHGSLLPRDTADFTGRGRALDKLTAALTGDGDTRCGLVVLHGLPGVGKTVLAVHAGHRLRAAFPDGQLLVQMRGPDDRPRAADEVLGELLRTFGLGRGAEGERQLDRERLLRAWLSNRRVLLVLDNAADERQVRPLLPGIGGSAVVVTGRRLLGLESACYLGLGPFSLDEALELLSRTAGQARLRAEPDAAEEIVRACDLLPRAVRIAGLKLVARRHLPLRRCADRLADPGNRLDELSVRDLTMRTGVESLYRDLTPAERALFRCIGALPSPRFDLPTLAGPLACSLDDAETALDGLIQAHVVTEVHARETTAYRMPSLLWAYARERAGEDPAVAWAATRAGERGRSTARR
ncbi:AfsR/SARP family transcriptional regulator [Spongiactinospora sp. TRM90649]|uniref:AfsR/SARP family transcriptional regulator n=1 Tax=Spongiactinospora sp. TRM90649 TaxID=3031114 RepID=UPI0023FA1418|nr:AfsR/SARP family transcriptional regulator [Spongiactinospora sp. TRM90649]MDF5759107.1 BTAD domain-containing putative transcriptional regulator [Spongiactinospora sp. TRM90649]